ncbi:MAG: hypothetical protein ACKVVT_12120 [Dehalococcoidia bacterium]
MDWLTPSDHVATQAGFWMGLAGLLLGVAGILFAWWQLRKTRTAVEAATAAIRATTGRVARTEFLTTLIELQEAERDVDRALALGDRPALGEAIRTWRQVARQVLAAAKLDQSDWPGMTEELGLALQRIAALDSSRPQGALFRTSKRRSIASGTSWKILSSSCSGILGVSHDYSTQADGIA